MKLLKYIDSYNANSMFVVGKIYFTNSEDELYYYIQGNGMFKSRFLLINIEDYLKETEF